MKGWGGLIVVAVVGVAAFVAVKLMKSNKAKAAGGNAGGTAVSIGGGAVTIGTDTVNSLVAGVGQGISGILGSGSKGGGDIDSSVDFSQSSGNDTADYSADMRT